MNILYIDHDSAATGLYRCIFPAYFLRKYTSANTVGIGDIFNALLPKQAMEAALEMAEIIIFYRAYNDSELLMLDLARADKKLIIFEIDDYLHKLRESNPASKIWNQQKLEKLDYIMRSCHAITTTNPRLAKIYSEMFGKRCYVLQNQIDHQARRWNVHKEPKDYIKIGWFGSSSHSEDIDILAEVSPEILKKYDNIQFQFGGVFPNWMQELQNKYGERRIINQEHWLGLFDYPQEIAQFDIGLIPIADNEFNIIGKSDLKFLEYSMAGVPSVASNLYPYKETIKHNENGLLTDNSPEGWIFQISRLIEDKEFREELARKAKEYILTERTYEKNIFKWYKAYSNELYLKRKYEDEERKKEESKDESAI